MILLLLFWSSFCDARCHLFLPMSFHVCFVALVINFVSIINLYLFSSPDTYNLFLTIMDPFNPVVIQGLESCLALLFDKICNVNMFVYSLIKFVIKS